MPRYNPILSQLPTYPQQALNKRKAQIRAQGKELFDFGVGDPVEPVPEFIRNALKEAIPPHCGYPRVLGSKSLRQSIADYIDRRYALQLDTERHIVPVSGAKEAVFHLPLLFLDAQAEDRCVLFPDPGYPAYYRGTLFAGGIPKPIPLSGDYIFRLWEVEEALLKKTRILWLNTPHNPSGSTMTKAQLQRTVDLCRAHNIVCISDETYADIYQTEPPASVLECGLDHVLSIHSLSKRSGMTGYRSGFVAGDPNIIKKFVAFRANPGLVPQTFVNAAAQKAWGDDGHVQERRAIFSKKKDLFLEFFAEQNWEVIGKEASLYLWLKVPTEESGEEYALRLLEHGIVVSPGSMFATSSAGNNYIRLAMVPDEKSCRDAIEKWKKSFHRRGKL